MKKAVKYLTGVVVLAGVGLLAGTAVAGSVTGLVGSGNREKAALATEAVGEAAVSEVLVEERVEQRRGKETYTFTFLGEADESIVVYRESLAEGVVYGYNMSLTDPEGETVIETGYPEFPAAAGLEDSKGDYFAFALPTTGEYELKFTLKASGRDAEDVLPQVSEHLFRIRKAAGYQHLTIVANSLFWSGQFERAIPAYEVAVQAEPEAYAPYFWQTYAYGQMLLSAPDYADKALAIRRAAAQKMESVSVDQGKVISLEAVHQMFKLLPPEDQTVVVRNFQQIADIQSAAVERGDLEAAESDVQYYIDAITLFENGTASEHIKENIDLLYYFFLSEL